NGSQTGRDLRRNEDRHPENLKASGTSRVRLKLVAAISSGLLSHQRIVGRRVDQHLQVALRHLRLKQRGLSRQNAVNGQRITTVGNVLVIEDAKHRISGAVTIKELVINEASDILHQPITNDLIQGD